MVKKTFIRILFICITSVLFNVLYHVFFTEFKYTRNPPYILPDLELPTFFIITFVLAFILEKYLLKSKGMWALIFGLFAAIIFHTSATAIEDKQTYLYEHYYKTTPYKSLIHLKKYEKLRDNRLTLKKALKNQGIKVESIEGGFTEKGHKVHTPEKYHKRLYYVNDDLYIIFDWDNEVITARADKREMLQLLYEKYDHINGGMHSDTLHAKYRIGLINEKSELLKNYRIEPTEKGTFKFTETQ